MCSPNQTQHMMHWAPWQWTQAQVWRPKWQVHSARKFSSKWPLTVLCSQNKQIKANNEMPSVPVEFDLYGVGMAGNKQETNRIPTRVLYWGRNIPRWTPLQWPQWPHNWTDSQATKALTLSNSSLWQTTHGLWSDAVLSPYAANGHRNTQKFHFAKVVVSRDKAFLPFTQLHRESQLTQHGFSHQRWNTDVISQHDKSGPHDRHCSVSIFFFFFARNPMPLPSVLH